MTTLRSLDDRASIKLFKWTAREEESLSVILFHSKALYFPPPPPKKCSHCTQVFSSDIEEETIVNEPASRKKRQKFTGPEPVILKDIPPPKCLENSLEFLKKRKMEVPRSHATLKNAERAFRLISSRGSLLTKS